MLKITVDHNITPATHFLSLALSLFQFLYCKHLVCTHGLCKPLSLSFEYEVRHARLFDASTHKNTLHRLTSASASSSSNPLCWCHERRHISMKTNRDSWTSPTETYFDWVCVCVCVCKGLFCGLWVRGRRKQTYSYIRIICTRICEHRCLAYVRVCIMRRPRTWSECFATFVQVDAVVLQLNRSRTERRCRRRRVCTNIVASCVR